MSENNKCVVWCGPEDIPKKIRSEDTRVLRLNTFPRGQNVFLKLENIHRRLAFNMPSITVDMLEIASYVYCADQAVSRGGKAGREHGKDWYRNFRFEIPVRNLTIWNRDEVKEALGNTLNFLSDDQYEFSFRKLSVDVLRPQYFDFYQGRPWFDADEVLLFSGGLDSVAGAIDEVFNQGKKAVLVSHRPVAKISTRQERLISAIRAPAARTLDFLHVPVWVNKESGLTKDENQRSRSFLYAMLAAAIAITFQLKRIRFFENGIVSMNLPLSPQLIGARASRTTHPRVLHDLSLLVGELTGQDFVVENPFFRKTKSDVVKLIKDSGWDKLIRHTVSCSRVRTTDKKQTHCGVCTQCIERRIATLHNDLGREDPDQAYSVKHLLAPIRKREDRIMVESYVKHTMELHEMSPEEFFQKFGEVNRALRYLHLPTNEAAKRIYELHLRHGQQVCEVVDNQIKVNASRIREGKLDPDSLLAMVVKQPRQLKGQKSSEHTFSTPEGATWEDITIEIVSVDSIRIKVMGVVRRVSALDMGFRDRRKGDATNRLWDLLVKFAESSGTLSWATRGAKVGEYKSIQSLKDTLKRYFDLADAPIKSYEKDIGYVARFKIADRRFGQA